MWLFRVVLVALIAISAIGIYAAVLNPLITQNDFPKIFWILAFVSAIIPAGFFCVYGVGLLFLYGKSFWKSIARQDAP